MSVPYSVLTAAIFREAVPFGMTAPPITSVGADRIRPVQAFTVCHAPRAGG